MTFESYQSLLFLDSKEILLLFNINRTMLLLQGKKAVGVCVNPTAFNSIAPILFAFIQSPAGKSNMMKLGVRLGVGLLEQSRWQLSWQQTVERNQSRPTLCCNRIVQRTSNLRKLLCKFPMVGGKS